MNGRPTALITGASEGIGLALAREFAIGGHDLVLVARRAEALDRAATELRDSTGAETLDPADSFWWPSGGHLFQLLRINQSQLPADSTISFVRSAVDAARDQPSEHSVRVVEVGSLLLADLHLLSGHHDAALDSLSSDIEYVPELRRAEHYSTLAELSEQSRDSRSTDYRRLASLLRSPYAWIDDDTIHRDDAILATQRLFPQLAPMLLIGDEHRTTRLEWDDDTVRILFFWSASCQPSSLATHQLVNRLRNSESALNRHDVSIYWIHSGRHSLRDQVLEAAESLQLPIASVYFSASDAATGESLADRLFVDGTPWVYLVLPNGQVAREMIGASEGWIEKLEQTIDRYSRATLAR